MLLPKCVICLYERLIFFVSLSSFWYIWTRTKYNKQYFCKCAFFLCCFCSGVVCQIEAICFLSPKICKFFNTFSAINLYIFLSSILFTYSQAVILKFRCQLCTWFWFTSFIPFKYSNIQTII